MNRRCSFLDTFSMFNLNMGEGEYVTDEHGKKVPTDTKQLGSTLMDTMLKEVAEFCDPAIKENWSLKPHQQVTVEWINPYDDNYKYMESLLLFLPPSQLIYDFKDGEASLGLISLHPEKLLEKDKMKFKKIGVKIPSMTYVHNARTN